jgi:uncharacterized membrane protein YdjX (TVP38/TMEM64 family)
MYQIAGTALAMATAVFIADRLAPVGSEQSPADQGDGMGHAVAPQPSAAEAATTRRRYRAAAALAVIGFSLLYALEVHVAAEALWTVLRNAPAGLLTSPTPDKILTLCLSVKKVADGQTVAVVSLVMTFYLLLQTFCIPGTVLLNTVMGVLVGVKVGLPMCVAAGTLGAASCYSLSQLLGSGFADRVDQRLMQGKGIPKLRAQVSKNRNELMAYLLFLRLTPVLPNWLINLASPIVGVPLRAFALATFIGITPQTYLSVRFGSIAAHKAQGGSVGSIVTVYDTVAIGVIGVVVVVAARLKKRFAGAVPTD